MSEPQLIIESIVSFTPIRQIGEDEGRNSSVFLAKDNLLDDKIAVKELSLKRNLKPIDIVHLEIELNKFVDEAKILNQNKHARILPLRYCSLNKELHKVYIVLPYMKNGSINQVIKVTPINLRDSLAIFFQLLDAIEYIHINKFAHLDIKPSNILFADNNRDIYLSDFGQACIIDEFGLIEPTPMYTFHLPPERFAVSKLTPQADIYQIGLTMYRILNGNLLFYQNISNNIKTEEQLKKCLKNGQIINNSLYLPHIPQQMRSIIKKCVDKKPAKRYQTVDQIKKRLANIDVTWNIENISADLSEFVWVNGKDTIRLIKNKLFYDVEGYKASVNNTIRTNKAHCKRNLPTLADAFQSIEQMMHR